MTADLLRQIADDIEQGRVVAVHCHGGSAKIGEPQEVIDADGRKLYTTRSDAGFRVLCVVYSSEGDYNDLPHGSGERANAGVLAALGAEALRDTAEADYRQASL